MSYDVPFLPRSMFITYGIVKLLVCFKLKFTVSGIVCSRLKTAPFLYAQRLTLQQDKKNIRRAAFDYSGGLQLSE